jgi:hypothetical protein
LGRIDWDAWGKANASGTGVEWVNNCKPDCADGRYVNWGAIKLHAWRPVPHHFTRLTVNGPRIHHTYVLHRDPYGWFWQ